VPTLKLAQGVRVIWVLRTVFAADGGPLKVHDTVAAGTGASSSMR
jgi:hypothetical protein